MKTTLPTPSSAPPKTLTRDPSQRLSLAVKKLDQLINRAHQLGSLSDQIFPENQARTSIPSSEAGKIPPASSRASTSLNTFRHLLEENEES